MAPEADTDDADAAIAGRVLLQRLDQHLRIIVERRKRRGPFQVVALVLVRTVVTQHSARRQVFVIDLGDEDDVTLPGKLQRDSLDRLRLLENLGIEEQSRKLCGFASRWRWR